MCRRLAILSVALAFSGCWPALEHPPRLESTSMPASFPSEDDAANSAQLAYSAFFTDPKLTALIETALTNNQELNIVALEIDIAKTEIITREGEFLPRLDFKVGAGIEKVGKYTSQGAADEANGVPEHLADFQLGFSASWEIDIWSKLRNATKAATLRYLGSVEGRKFAVSVLVAEIAESYYELLALDGQLDVLKQNISIQKSALEVVRLQKEAARVSELAVKRFEAEVLKNQSRLFTVQQQIVEAESRINFLVGRFPQTIDRSTESFATLVPATVHAGIPYQLLENRPDVKRAELALGAAKLDVKVAKAAFLPKLGIGANIGYQSFDFLKMLATPASLLYSAGADLLVPLLNRKGLNADYYAANAKQMQAVVAYERAILKAYIEVANRVKLIGNLEQSYALRSQEVEKLNESVDISSRLFNSARADYMEVLLTRRDALESQMELIELRKQQMTSVVGLYQALGGGWR